MVRERLQERFGDSDDAAVRTMVSELWRDRAASLREQGRLEEAVTALRRCLDERDQSMAAAG